MSAHEYSHGLPKFSVNFLVRRVSNSLIYRDVLGATVRYSRRLQLDYRLRIPAIP
jgi:hypothetical protein